jgi:hypothetical protein
MPLLDRGEVDLYYEQTGEAWRPPRGLVEGRL